MIIENWLSVGAGVFLIGMVLYGHYRGFLKQCVSLGALVLTIVIVKIATPYMTGFIKDNPSIRQGAADAILSIAGWEEPSMEDTGICLSLLRMYCWKITTARFIKYWA